ncbi:hypothetical protein [[Kitasatospora] papulosa]|uniref:hypothetical protein n=1 Tax=[Kitasatospora] papulosa TaxID=1464011 RepID=UPI0036C967D2
MNRINAELTATKIVALTGPVTVPPCEEASPERQVTAVNSTTPAGPPGECSLTPARRKNHLSLYKGGAVVTVVLGCVEALRASIGPRHIATGIAAASLVAGTGAIYAAGPFDVAPSPRVTPPPATAPDHPRGGHTDPDPFQEDELMEIGESRPMPASPSASSKPSPSASPESEPATDGQAPDEPSPSPTGGNVPPSADPTPGNGVGGASGSGNNGGSGAVPGSGNNGGNNGAAPGSGSSGGSETGTPGQDGDGGTKPGHGGDLPTDENNGEKPGHGNHGPKPESGKGTGKHSRTAFTAP